jgi:hypothetical protein
MAALVYRRIRAYARGMADMSKTRQLTAQLGMRARELSHLLARLADDCAASRPDYDALCDQEEVIRAHGEQFRQAWLSLLIAGLPRNELADLAHADER